MSTGSKNVSKILDLMKYISIASHSRKWLDANTLNPERVHKYYVRAKTKKRCIELLNKYDKGITAHYVNQFGLNWTII